MLRKFEMNVKDEAEITRTQRQCTGMTEVLGLGDRDGGYFSKLLRKTDKQKFSFCRI